MIGAELERGVDRADVADAFVEGVDGLVDHRHQDAVHDEGRIVLGVGGDLAQALGEDLDGLVGRGRRGDAPDDLDQAHDRRRVHEMQADELLGPVGRGGQPRDRDRRSVRGQDGVRLQVRDQRLEDGLLDLFVLGGRLDDEIDVGDLRGVRRRGDARQGGLGVGLADGALGDLAGKVLLDLAQGGLEPLGAHVVQANLAAAQRAHMGDARSHLAGADDADGVDVAHTLFRALQGVCSRGPAIWRRRAALASGDGVPSGGGGFMPRAMREDWRFGSSKTLRQSARSRQSATPAPVSKSTDTVVC